MKKTQTQPKDFTLNVLRALAFKGRLTTVEMLATIKPIMKMTKKDKLPFRGTQTKFDKAFYNFINKRDFHLFDKQKKLVEFTPTSSGTFIMSITVAGTKYLQNNG